MNDWIRTILVTTTLSTNLLATGCIEPPPTLGERPSTDMSGPQDAKMDVEMDMPDARAEADLGVSDMRAGVDMRESTDMANDEDMAAASSCPVVGVVECVGDVGKRRVCGVDKVWHERAACFSYEDCTAGECVPEFHQGSGSAAVLVEGPLSGPASRLAFPAFGSALELGSDSFVVGAYTHQSDAQDFRASGAVFTFNRNTDPNSRVSWERTMQELKLDRNQLVGLPENGSILGGCAEFGRSLAMSEDGLLLAVGAPGLNLVEDTCIEETYAPDGDAGEQIKYYVSEMKHGAVFLYTRMSLDSKWEYHLRVDPLQLSSLTAAPTTNSNFGISLAMSPLGDRLFVGASLYDEPGASNCGAVFEYSITREQEQPNATFKRKIQPSTQTSESYFGATISYAPDRELLAVGSFGRQERTGAVYVADVSKDNIEMIEVTIPGVLVNNKTEFGRRVLLNADGTRLMSTAPNYCYGNRRTDSQLCDSASFKGVVANYNINVNPLAATAPNLWYARAQSMDTALSAPALYGADLAMNRDGSQIAIGAPGSGPQVSMKPLYHKGVVELFNNAAPASITKPQSPTTFPNANNLPMTAKFGARLSKITDGGLMLISADAETTSNDPHGKEAGRVYLYRVHPPSSSKN